MTRLRLIRRLLRRFWQIDNRSRALLAEAVLGLLAARLTLLFVSFPRLGRKLGTLVPPSDDRVSKTSVLGRWEQKLVATDVSWAVTRTARYVPFKAVCLQQAIAAHNMLRRRGIPSVMHFGASRGQPNPLDSHAWLDAAGVEVTGYPVEERLAEIACFI